MKGKFLVPLSVGLLLLAGCQDKNEAQKTSESEVVQSGEETAEDVAQMRLAEQGFVIKSIDTFQNEDIILFELNRDGEEESYFAMMDENYDWIVTPTNEIKEMDYGLPNQPEFDTVINEGETPHNLEDGLIAFAVKDDRPREDNDLLWGFMNTKGEWVIKPQYRSIEPFHDGAAVVQTVEEDRDDLQNSRKIAIDINGKELFEIEEKHNIDESIVAFDSFHNGYLKTSKGVYNKDGELFSLDFLPDFKESEDEYDEEDSVELFKSYEIIGDKVVTIFDNKIKVFSLQGNLEKEFSYLPSDDELNELGESELEPNDLKLYTNEELAKSNSFIVKNKIYSLDGKVVFDHGNMLIQDDLIITRSGFDDDGNATWNLYDLKGNPIKDENKAGIQLGLEVYNNEPHWVKENEYYKLISTDGKDLIGEDRKVSDVLNPEDKIVEAEVTDPTTLEETEVLINTETLEFIRVVDL